MRFRPLMILTFLTILLLSVGPTAAIDTPHASPQPGQDEPAPLLKIGDVQGAVTDDETDPENFGSPYRNDRVRVSGVITNLIMLNTDGREVSGFFLQETAENSDGDPHTSDGIQAIIGASPSLDDYTPAVGDIITIEGKVDEYYGLTRLTRLAFVSLDGHIDHLTDAIPPVEINPGDVLLTNSIAYERLEGMRVIVPVPTLVVSPTHLFSSTNDTEVYVIRSDHPVAQREDPLARRIFRDPHEMDDGLPGENPYRISVEGNILKAYAGDYNVNLPAYNTYDTFTSSLVGNIVYSFGRYTLQIEALPDHETSLLPDSNAPVQAPDRAIQFTVAAYNIENFYDYYNDPIDFRDTPGDGNLNYVPLSVEHYDARVTKAALSIINDLHAPDIIAFQEIEDQDVCINGGQVYGTCGDTDDADGMPDVLQDIAIRIGELTDGEILYLSATDRESADDRGISQGYLYRADRVDLPAADPADPILGERPEDPDARYYEFNQSVSNPKSLNQRFGPGTPLFSRPPLVGLFHIYHEVVGEGDYVEVYLSDNHFKSDPTGYNALREFQSLYNLSFVEALQAETPDVYFIILGDLNSFRESQEMAVLEPTMTSLWEFIPAESRYTYIFAGQTQTLDYIYATPNLVEHLDSVRVAHINADYSFTYETDASLSWRAADHDPIVATFNFPE